MPPSSGYAMRAGKRFSSPNERRAVVAYWCWLGFTTRNANGLINAGFRDLEELRAATDQDLAVIRNVGQEGKAIIYRLIDRHPPLVLQTANERSSIFEVIWRGRFGDERFDPLLAAIADLAGPELATVNVGAARGVDAGATEEAANLLGVHLTFLLLHPAQFSQRIRRQRGLKPA